MTPRDYQEYAVHCIFEYFINGGKGNPIVAMPTGTGKSLVIALFLKLALMQYPATRVMKLTHVKELIEQNLEKLLAVWPEAPAGVFSAGLNKKEIGKAITFGGVGSVVKVAAYAFGRIDLLLIDECHLLSPNDKTMYHKVINALKAVNPHLKVIGFTATQYRLGQGLLTDGDDPLFTDICIDMTELQSFNWFIQQGYLSRLTPKPTVTDIDDSGLHIRGGEFKQDEAQALVDTSEISEKAVREIITNGQDRNHWLVFGAGIDHVMHVTEMFDSFGVPATCVHSKMTAKQRDMNIAAYIHAEYRVMVNNGILTTGFDFPGIDLIGMLRHTMSPGLWVQMLGRGTRPVYAPGYNLTTTEGRLQAIYNGPKRDCLVLDFAKNTRRLGPINDPVIPKKKRKGAKGQAPVKLCETCNTLNHASVRFCENCGYEFPKQTKITEYAGTEELIADEEIKTEIFVVDRVVYREHQKRDSKPTIKVSYYCGLRVFNEWVCLEHEGFPSKKARTWWRQRHPHPPPQTTAEAMHLINDLTTPISINVWLRKTYDEILGYNYEKRTTTA